MIRGPKNIAMNQGSSWDFVCSFIYFCVEILSCVILIL